jgi:purine-binding chemotaxis protein CheW
VGLEAVAEVVEADRLVRLAHCPPQVLGLCTVRRDIIPILSLAPAPTQAQVQTEAESEGPEAARESRLVALILRSDLGAWGIRIDREGTVVADDAAVTLASSPGVDHGATVLGTLRRGESTHTIIDPVQTWHNVRGTVEAWYQK